MNAQIPTKDVVVIGAGLTGLSLSFFLKQAGINLCVLESQNRAGGVIQSIEKDGFMLETGPNTGVLATIEAVELFEQLQADCKLIVANENVKKRYILKNGQWEALPQGLMQAIKTPLFTFGDKLRILLEPFRKRGTEPDESLASFVKRRMGNSFLDYAIDPFILGVYAGDPSLLVTRFALPKLYQLEQEYGSLIGGSIKKMRKGKTETAKKVNRKVFTFEGGLQSLTKALVKRIGEANLQLDAQISTIEPQEGGFLITYTQQSQQFQIFAQQVITSTAGHILPKLLTFLEDDLLTQFSALKYAKVVEVAVGFKEWHGRALDGFGGLIPFKEDREILGALFLSSLFDGRAPKRGAQITFFLGGMRKPWIVDYDDTKIMEIVQSEISNLLGQTNNKADIVHIQRYTSAIPQYQADTGLRIDAAAKASQQYPGLWIGGNLIDGIGMADRIKQAKELSLKAIKYNSLKSKT